MNSIHHFGVFHLTRPHLWMTLFGPRWAPVGMTLFGPRWAPVEISPNPVVGILTSWVGRRPGNWKVEFLKFFLVETRGMPKKMKHSPTIVVINTYTHYIGMGNIYIYTYTYIYIYLISFISAHPRTHIYIYVYSNLTYVICIQMCLHILESMLLIGEGCINTPRLKRSTILQSWTHT